MNLESAKEKLASSFRAGSDLREKVLRECSDSIVRAAELIATSLQKGGKIFFCGNGGSAADAQHLAAELVGRFVKERRALPGIALTTDTSILTSVGNDYGFEQVFVRQVEALGRTGDVLVAISTSGNSPNVEYAAHAARKLGIQSIGLLGRDGGSIAKTVDLPIIIQSTVTARVQECHITIGHVICELIEDELFCQSEREQIAAEPSSTKILDWPALLRRREQWRAQRKTVAWTNGCFDLVHTGHLRSLRAARELGDVLVVGLNSDSSTRQLKGPTRPIVPEAERAELLAAFSFVDAVIIFNETTPEAALAKLKPDIHCKGADYAPPNGKPIPEAKLVESYGGQVRFLPLIPETSTTRLIERIAARAVGS